ncbi:SusC/RagA family TonB-linked outer membrane protein [Pedobacter yulinensis]|uniref:SusC/RagA family TonB-linked outer membrane protein n=1 Tax=Pedobacter yulinensis TaxID=2126353 RepID=A0A2T3HIM0_9SPHI|nr:SusC/RagA family TonB-linked outer membrane protein [Pedobacter yulinensis]PST82282.1 SusC/RagA family TonB-linked outer membrane protein [Pedobacter yulinensis]
MSKHLLKIMAVCMVALFCSLNLLAQDSRTLTGKVTDGEGQAIPAANIAVKGRGVGTGTDANGNFSVKARTGDVLVISYIGYTTKEVTVGSSNTINVTLAAASNELSEIVVTALGIKREKKSLGYAVQEISGTTLTQAREPNVTNALTGKVAGLQITRSSNGPAGSSRITLRGNNSLTGNNQPLIVVDGVPVNNFIGATNNDFWNPSQDMGNGLSDINPEDIATMSVLKGPSAAALYGTRAGNGVILITTKSGSAQKGLGITVSSSLGIENIFTTPELQSSYGQGTNNIFDNRSTQSWGPKIEGQTVQNWDGRNVPLSAYDNIGNFLGQGISSNQSISLSQGFNNTTVYTSVNRLDDKSMIPGVKYNRTNLMARATSKFGKEERWSTDTKVQYSNANAINRPISGNRTDNPFFVTYLHPRSLDITEFSGAVNPATNNMFWYGEPGPTNPYWTQRYNTNQDIRDRFIMNGSIKYQFTDWLNAEVKGGADLYTTNTEAKLYGGSPISATGRYSMGKQTFTETNFSTLISASKDNLVGKFGGALTLGGNLMSQKNSGLNSSSGELNARDLFSLNNGKNNPTVEQIFNQRRINSVYGSAQVNYDGYLFVDATFRNDWSSTFSTENRSFFYPSVSLSYVFTDMFTKMGAALPEWLSYGKLRASYASVGNDLNPYELYNTYVIGKDPNGNTTAGRNSTLFNPQLKNELIKSFEAGTELRFFKSRFGVDFSWYKSDATNQLINLPMDPLSGYSFRKINAGNIRNQGFEIMADARIFNDPQGFTWNLSGNFSRNRNTIESLYGDVKTYRLGGYDNLRIEAVVGGNYGEIYGSRFLRVQDANSPYFGQLILNAQGLPQADAEAVKLGDQQAFGLMGITNSFAYKGISLSFQVDARFGGEIFSGTNVSLQRAGTAALTAPDGVRENFVVPGVIRNTSTQQFQPNTTPVSQQLYWTQVTNASGNLGINEANIYDASNIRLRNVQLGYDLPAKYLGNSPVRRARVGVSCNNVWLIKSHMNGIDPESIFNTGTNATGFENASAPTNRSFLFNLTLGF